MLMLHHCFQRPLGTEFPLNFPETIFVPIALIATLSWRKPWHQKLQNERLEEASHTGKEKHN